jgi:hypothetical protein
MTQNLLGPNEEKIKFGTGGYGIRRLDVNSEVKLRTLISVTDQTRSSDALKAAIDYTATVINLWQTESANFRAATEVLSVLDASKWPAIAEANLQAGLKSALLGALGEWPDGSAIGAIADYASGGSAHWSKDDQQLLDDLAERYLENGFNEELADCSDIEECDYLSGTLDVISNCCGLDVAGCRDQINERMADLADPEPDDDDREVRTWEHDRDENPLLNPEAEVRRLFDGLR